MRTDQRATCLMALRGIIRRKRLHAVAAISFALSLSAFAGPALNLPDGSSIEILKVSHGTSHNMDTRTAADKAYAVLPDRFKKMYRRRAEGGQMSVTGPYSVAFSFVFRNHIVGTPALADYYYILSDPSGWYQSGELKGMFGGSRESYLTGVRMVPRASQSLKLSIFSPRISLSTPSAPLANVILDNPQYDSRITRKPAKLPAPQSAGFCQITPMRFLTGVYLDDLIDFPLAYSRASHVIPSSVDNLTQSKPVAAKMPQEPNTILLFEAASTTSALSQLAISSVALKDSHGSRYEASCMLYHRANTYSIVIPKNIPVTDGDVKMQFTLVENPPTDSPSWQSVTFSPNGPESSLTIPSSSKQIKVMPLADPTKFKIEMSPVAWGEHFGNYAVEIQGSDNQSIPFQYEDQSDEGKKHIATLALNDSASTGPYQFRIAAPFLHSVTLTGVPELP